jgi:ubiquinone/menaquinone biosynthesis C-methylase UbiE
MNTLTLYRAWVPPVLDFEKPSESYDLLAAPKNRYLAPLVKPGSRVLAAGCGDGSHVLAFAKAGATAVGIDLSRKSIAQMMAEARRRSLFNASWAAGDILNLPFADSSFDLYTSFGVHDRCLKPKHGVLLGEAYRVLEPGGLIYLEVPHLWSVGSARRKVQRWFGEFSADPSVRQRELTRRYLVNCAESAGFRTRASHVFNAWDGFEQGFSLGNRRNLGRPNPFGFLTPVFKSFAGWCEERELLGETLVYVGSKPRVRE